MDTGVFAENRYFDVFVEYAKADVRYFDSHQAVNRGRTPRHCICCLLCGFAIHVVGRDARRPSARILAGAPGSVCVELQHWQYGKRWLIGAGQPQLLFTENETNRRRLNDGRTFRT